MDIQDKILYLIDKKFLSGFIRYLNNCDILETAQFDCILYLGNKKKKIGQISKLMLKYLDIYGSVILILIIFL